METLTQATTQTAGFFLSMPKHILSAFLTVPVKGRRSVLPIIEGIKVEVQIGCHTFETEYLLNFGKSL